MVSNNLYLSLTISYLLLTITPLITTIDALSKLNSG